MAWPSWKSNGTVYYVTYEASIYVIQGDYSNAVHSQHEKHSVDRFLITSARYHQQWKASARIHAFWYINVCTRHWSLQYHHCKSRREFYLQTFYDVFAIGQGTSFAAAQGKIRNVNFGSLSLKLSDCTIHHIFPIQIVIGHCFYLTQYQSLLVLAQIIAGSTLPKQNMEHRIQDLRHGKSLSSMSCADEKAESWHCHVLLWSYEKLLV